MLKRCQNRMRFHGRGGCPFCGGSDEELNDENSHLKKEIFGLQNQMDILENKIELQEDVIKEQIKSIYDCVKDTKENTEEPLKNQSAVRSEHIIK